MKYAYENKEFHCHIYCIRNLNILKVKLGIFTDYF